MISAFVAALTLGILSGRVTAVGWRGGYREIALWRSALGAAAVAMTFSLFVWGFASLAWYWPILAFLLGNAAGLIVTRSSWPALVTFQPVLDLFVLGIGLYLWMAQWPF